jgi:hypothetical protein
MYLVGVGEHAFRLCAIYTQTLPTLLWTVKTNSTNSSGKPHLCGDGLYLRPFGPPTLSL